MVQFIPGDKSWSEAFQNFGSGLAQGYTNRADENAIQNAVQGLGPNASAQEILKAVTGTKTYGNQAKENFFKNTLGAQQFDELKRHNQAVEERDTLKAELAKLKEEKKTAAELNDATALLNSSSLPDEKKQEYLAKLQNGELTFNGIKELTKPEKPSEFQKKLAGKNVELYSKAVEDLPKAQRSLQDLSKLEELNKKLAGPTGYFKALNPFNQDASEMKALGFGVLDAVVKIFNPSGPIAQKKLEQLKDIFSISPLDSSAKTTGKIRALQSYAQRAKDIAEQRIALFNEYEGSPPLDKVAKLDAQGNELIDQMSKKGVPKVQYYSKSNGKPLKDLSEEQIETLMKQGLITDVKP